MKSNTTWLLGIALVASACTVEDELARAPHKVGTEQPPASDTAAAPPGGETTNGALPAAGLVRLTNAQYKRTLRDLIGADFVLRERFPRDHASGIGFPTTSPVTSLEIDRYVRSAEQAGSVLATKLPPTASCAFADDTCVEGLIRGFTRRAFRRPPTDEEVTALANVFRAAIADWGYSREEALAVALQAALIHPDFLYRTELGAPDAPRDESARVPLTGLEVAARLSYLLWGTTPDEELLALGESGALTQPAIVKQQAERLLADARSEDGLGEMFVYWLGLDTLHEKGKSGDRWFGFWIEHANVADSMLTEVRHLGVTVVRRGGTIADLLTTREAYVNADLAPIYDLPPPTVSGFAPVTLDGNQRAGILTRAAFLATHAYADDSAPIRRGKIVRMRVLCNQLPPPPGDAFNNLPAVPASATARQKAETLTAAAGCQSCHALMNPLGFAFESFDQAGAYRTTNNGQPVDTSGALAGVAASGTFTNATELMTMVGASAEARSCFARQLFRFGAARSEEPADEATISAVAQVLDGSGGDMRAALFAFVTSDGFLKHPVQK